MNTTTQDWSGSEASRSTEQASSGKGPRARSGTPALPAVLIVDDVPDNLLALEGMLRRDDVEIVTALSGRTALEALLIYDVAVAIIDVMMPEMDGFELAELIRGVDRTRHVPIIFVTAGSKEYRVFTGYMTGAIDFLFKPLDERVLRAKVNVLVTLEKQRRQLELAREQAEQARAETEVLLRLAQAASRSEKPSDLLDPTLDAVHEVLGAERSAILLFDDGGLMRFQAWRGLSETYRIAVDGHSPWSIDEQDPQPILIPNVEDSEAMARYRSIFAAEGIRAIGFIPLVSERRELLGKFMLYWRHTKPFSAHDKDLALAIASQIGQALTRARLRVAERNGLAKAEAAAARMAFIAEASVVLSSSLDHEATLRRVAELAVPRLADWCAVNIATGPEEETKRVAIVHMNPAKAELAQEIGRRYPTDPRTPHGVPQVLRTARSEIYSEIPDDLLKRVVPDPEYLRFVRELGMTSAMMVPIVMGTRTLGVITFVAAESGRRYGEADLEIAEEIGRRAGLAIQNARLFEAEKRAREEAQRVEAALRDSEVRHRALFEVSVYGVITIDEDGVIETANPAAERIFGRPVAELVGRNITLLMPEPYRGEHASYLDNYRRTGQRKIIGIGREVLGQRKDGSQFPMDLAVSEFRVGEKRYFNGIVIDITERKQLEQARETAVAELEQTLLDNEIFAGVLAHDLRNPLSAIVMTAKFLLNQSKGDEAVVKSVTRIVSSGTRMTRMIEQLLDFTRARVGGGIDLQVREADLGQVCEQAVAELDVANPAWKMKVESLGNLRGTWDSDRLLQVVSNLLANAGQHGSAEGIILIKLDGTDPDSVALEVHNDGTIPESLLPTLFAPFRGTQDRKSPGLGLGLFIAKEIVVGHGGALDVTSSDAAGTSFKIRLPRHASSLPSGKNKLCVVRALPD